MNTAPPRDLGGTTGRIAQIGPERRRRRLAALLAILAVVVLAAVLLQRACGSDGRPRGLDVYRGLGAWVDVFDYVPAVGGEGVPVGEPDVDAMAAQGVRTIYLHAAFDSDAIGGDTVSGDLLVPLIRRAHKHGINVVGWYAPRFLEPEVDLRRLLAIARFDRDGVRFDGVAVDIEDRSLEAVPERNRRLVDLSRRFRDELGADATIGAVVLPTVLLEKVNRSFWPSFPWAEIGPFYDVWLPMTYWTDRLTKSGYRDPRRLITETVARTRELTGRADAPMHPIGGIGDKLTEDELATYAAVLKEVGALGGSVYDYRTMPTGGWGVLRSRIR